MYVSLGVSKNRGTPKSSHFNRVFHYKPSILGVKPPYFWKHPFCGRDIFFGFAAQHFFAQVKGQVERFGIAMGNHTEDSILRRKQTRGDKCTYINIR